MNSRIWIPAVAGALLLAACGQSDKNPSAGGDSTPGPESPAAAGDTATTPGGNAGDATTTPGTPSTPSDAAPPAESAPPPAEQPTNPPTTGGQ